MKRILCIWLPHWPIQRIAIAHPELQAKTIVLHTRDSRRGVQVAYCSRSAEKKGIWPGMSLAEVAAIMRKSNLRRKQIHFAEHDPREDIEALQRAAEWSEQFSPTVGLENSTQPSSLLLDITTSAPRLGGEEKLIVNINEAFRRRGYVISLAIAETLSAAWAIAHFGKESDLRNYSCDSPPPCDNNLQKDTKYEKQVGYEKCGSYLIPDGQAESAIQPLPVQSLRIDDETVTLLHQLGVETTSQLLELPRDGLRARFGSSLLLRIDQAIGAVEETFEAHYTPEPLIASLGLEHPTVHRDIIRDRISRLVCRLSQQLKDADQGAIRVVCELKLQPQQNQPVAFVTLTVGMYRPSHDAEHINSLLNMQLEQRTLPQPVQHIEVRVEMFTRLENQQHDLPGVFGESFGAHGQLHRPAPQQLAYLIDRISNRLGRDTVLGASLRSEPQPEIAYRYQPLTGSCTVARKSTTAATVRHQAAKELRPLFLTAQPVRIHTPNHHRPHRLPKTFGYENRTYTIRHAWGPERIETGWWRGQLIRRDYYHVEDTHGNRFWLFCNLHRGAWFVHGVF